MERQVELMTLFKKNLLEFFDDLIEQYPQEADLIMYRFFLSEQIPVESLMERFIKFVLPHRAEIAERNENFFIANDNIFGSSPKDKVIHFKNLYLGMNRENRETLFEWFDSFLMLVDKYQECM
jgi:hypothetical protein